ncbi:MAG: helix-turn-helix domain-containing protein [Beijerinckiaceae bacterium]
MKRAPNPVDKHVGSRVRMRRVLLGMSQEKLGEALGLTFQQVQKYEKGTNRIGASRLQEISKTLQVPPSFFFDGLPSGEIPRDAGFADEGTARFVTDFVATAEGLQLNKAFAQIKDAKVRRRIIDLVIALAAASDDKELSADGQVTR